MQNKNLVRIALILVWMNLAVGIIGSEDNLANLMYIGVLAGFGFTLILNGLFAALWVGSALLFRRAARTQPV